MKNRNRQIQKRNRKEIRLGARFLLAVFAVLMTLMLISSFNIMKADDEVSAEAEISFKEKVVENIVCIPYTAEEVELIAKTVYGEALVTQSDTEMAAVAWCILNRVDSPRYPDTIKEVVTQRKQFHGYREENPVDKDVKMLVIDVLNRYYEEKEFGECSGRILPKEYLFFYGDGRHNHFKTEYENKETWDWSLESPYEN